MENKAKEENKVPLEFKSVESTVIVYNGVSFKIKKMLSPQEQAFLIEKYIEDYFFIEEDKKLIQKVPYGLLNAEYNLKGYILQLCTNIDPASLYEGLYADTDFWKLVLSEII